MNGKFAVSDADWAACKKADLVERRGSIDTRIEKRQRESDAAAQFLDQHPVAAPAKTLSDSEILDAAQQLLAVRPSMTALELGIALRRIDRNRACMTKIEKQRLGKIMLTRIAESLHR